MKELSRCIVCLLTDNDCVILPGIGGFIARYEPAKYDTGSKSFISPKRIVGFNSAMTMNDGLIVQAYMQMYDLGYPDASHLLENDLKKVLGEIDSKGKFCIEGLGMLTRLVGGTYKFETSAFDIITPALYALPDFTVDILAGKGKQKVGEIVTPSPFKQKERGKNEELEQERETNQNNVYILSLRRSIVHGICAAAVAIIAFCCISSPLNNSLDKSSKASVLYDIINTAPQAQKNTGNKNISVSKAAVFSKATTEDSANSHADVSGSTTSTKIAANSEVEKPYTIVLASDVSKRNAEAFVNELKKQGFEQAEVYSGKSMRRVIFSHYASKTEAYNALRKLGNYDFAAEAWVMKLK